MGDVIQRKLKKYMAGTVCGILLLFFISIICLYFYELNNTNTRAIRVKSNQILMDLENNPNMQLSDKVKDNKYELPYCIFTLDGHVVSSTMESFRKDDKVDLHTIGTTSKYIVPIVIANEAKGILYIDGSEYQSKLAKRAFWFRLPWLIVILAGIAILLIRRQKIVRKDIWNPIYQIHQVTKDMLEGRYELGVVYDYEGEIGTLCRDFESMREEVIYGMQREIQSKEKERALYASISHDLKTPLAIITGYLEELILGVIKKEEIKSTLERSLEKARVLNKLIQDILEHSKAQLNQLSIQKDVVFAREFFSQLLEGYTKDSKLQDYEFTYQLPENIMVMIDQNRIAQVMQNLIDNAVKYRSDNLKISVSFEIIKEVTSILVIRVKDNGKGIEAADQPFIFDMFYRGNKARTQNISGSGLGLNISRYIIEQHGGQIECDSIVGIGTTMSFSIPLL